MSIEIITIGDELLIGQVTDTNSAWMSRQLTAVMMPIVQHTSIHDDAEQIKKAVNAALERADVVLLTGGLGPTKDDITKHTLCEIFSTRLVHSQEVEDNINRLWYQRNRKVINPLTATQALVPENCEVIQNEVGTAPIMLWEWDNDDKKKILISMPGVPYEMQYAITNHVIPRLQQEFPNETIALHHTTIVEGIPESALALQLEQWETSLPDYMHLAYLPAQGLVRLRLDAVSKQYSQDELRQQLDQQVTQLTDILGDAIIAQEDDALEVVLGKILKSKGQTIATAESCTGGTIASLLAKHAGSSEFYLGSVVSYSNEVKHNVLGVSLSDLEQYGAVSEPVVRQMAEGARRVVGADWALATSGIAGPGGGTADKPVGTIWIAVSGPDGTTAKCLHLGTLREQNILRTTQSILAMAIRMIR
ncbi:MAG: CinA family nicotinamide mononucleotide deamidase-related protein [Paludibacteraceae bacterium]|nr:CinA family nicotinamide mononucleotide deamidase-related protein [Paludibacteraceae bacterium]